MRVASQILSNLSNEDRRTDLIEYLLVATVVTLGVVATFGAITARIGMEFSTIASHI